MNPISINLTETEGITRIDEPVRVGIPIKKGDAFDIECLSVIISNSLEKVPFQVHSLAKWGDESLKWVLVEFAANVSMNDSRQYQLIDSDPKPQNSGVLTSEERADQVLVKNDQTEYSISKHDFEIVRTKLDADTSHDVQNVSCLITAKDKQNNTYKLIVDRTEVATDSGQFRHTILVFGRIADGSGNILTHYNSKVHFYTGQNHIEIDFCIHNTNAAKHENGLWDLGDPGSIYLSELSATVKVGSVKEIAIKFSHSAERLTFNAPQNVKLYQDSSGGDNWDSENHVNRLGQVPNTFKGFQFHVNDELHDSGERAEPLVSAVASTGCVTAYMDKFWQNFPSAIETTSSEIIIKLFPSEYSDCIELQAGEKKTQTFSLGFAEEVSSLDWMVQPLRPKLTEESVVRSGAFPLSHSSEYTNKLDAIVAEGLHGDANFFAKRESADEYGWRNFGEVFADHESLYLLEEKDDIYISHYNNQYDVIYGFLIQYVVTGRDEWFELMDDLAKHVVDIDIYHTIKDRVEYNGGFFWHTNHYTPTDTCTHRTHSSHKYSKTERDPSYGGGPSAEHCYSTGLLYHYYLTGNQDSRAAVLRLANWMMAAHEGSPGILAQLHSVKKREFGLLKQLIRKERPVPYLYPFSRGTGNYISTLLDVYCLTKNNELLCKIEDIIAATLHPDDDISERNLGNPEYSWSYLVLLNSLAKYLLLKEENELFDHAYFYARECFLTYTAWMLENEQIYLNNPDLLDIVNDTWAAQEIRKCNLMIYAAQYDTVDSDRYLQKAQEFLDYSVQTLRESPERQFTRVQAILLQNYGIQNQIDALVKKVRKEPAAPMNFGEAPVVSYAGLCKSSVKKLFSGMRHFSIQGELSWLRTRTNRHISESQ